MIRRCPRAVALTKSPSKYSPSTVTKSLPFPPRGVSRPYHKSCSLLIHRPTGSYRNCLALGSDQRRRLLSSSSQADKTEKVDSTGRINKRGGIWIYIGWTILGLVGVDQALQYKQDQENNERRRMLAEMQLDADNASFNVADWDESLPTMFTCKILHVDPGLDGTKMLTRSQNPSERDGTRSGLNKNIHRGDVVEILEAGVGPSQSYHLCRIRQQKSDSSDTATVAVGWYPIDYLERLN